VGVLAVRVYQIIVSGKRNPHATVLFALLFYLGDRERSDFGS
jgi:hypothetical protein